MKEEKEQAEPARKKRKTSSPVPPAVDDDLVDEANYDEDGTEILLSSGGRAVSLKSPKRVRAAKDEGWEDLDAEDEGDPNMVSEYVVDAFNYMMTLEVSPFNPIDDFMADHCDLGNHNGGPHVHGLPGRASVEDAHDPHGLVDRGPLEIPSTPRDPVHRHQPD